MTLKALGQSGAQFEGLETFIKPSDLTSVDLKSDEVSALCPVTGQPDWYMVKVMYCPTTHCIESKTFKLYLQSFRNVGMFCEEFAARIARDCYEALDRTVPILVEVTQKPRGGVSIVAKAAAGEED